MEEVFYISEGNKLFKSINECLSTASQMESNVLKERIT